MCFSKSRQTSDRLRTVIFAFIFFFRSKGKLLWFAWLDYVIQFIMLVKCQNSNEFRFFDGWINQSFRSETFCARVLAKDKNVKTNNLHQVISWNVDLKWIKDESFSVALSSYFAALQAPSNKGTLIVLCSQHTFMAKSQLSQIFFFFRRNKNYISAYRKTIKYFIPNLEAFRLENFIPL